MAKSDEPSGKSEREKRLAAELRANLRRRKVQVREKAETPSHDASGGDVADQSAS